jgi:hypothetical protein
MLKYDEIIKINNNKLTKKYIESLSKQQRLDLIDPIFNLLRSNGWMYPSDTSNLLKEYQRLSNLKLDLSKDELFNNSSVATSICKFFCPHFYSTTEIIKNKIKPNMLEIFENDLLLKKVIHNRLGLDWIDDDAKGKGINEAFNLSFRMIITGMRSSRLVPSISIFKPDIAKFVYLKFSNENDVVYDYSAGWGGRMLGAASCNRKYIGVDPLTASELLKMSNFLNLQNIFLFDSGSENVKLKENSVDLAFSSPPYFNQEFYSDSKTQSYNNGEDYFYNVYWNNTLDNTKFMLKPDKWFGVNIANYPEMLNMAIDKFGPVIQIIKLRTIKSHLNCKYSKEKFEPIYFFKNTK